MKYDQLLQLYFERSNALQWYWTVYVVVIGGLLAFSSIRKQPDAITGVLITILYCCFAYKNLGAIRDCTMQRLATLETMRQVPMLADTAPYEGLTRQNIEPTLQPPDYPGVRNFHIASDALTVAALWAMELRRRRMARTLPEAA